MQPGLRRTILVEMHKLGTMRMTGGICAGALGIVVIFTLVTLVTGGPEPTDGLPGLAGEEGQRLLLSSGSFAAVAIVVLGILVTAGEYRHRTIVGSLLFEPRRSRLLWSKIAVVAGISLVIGAVASALAVGVGALGLRSRGIGLDLGSGELAAIIAGTTCYVGVTAVIGCAVGALVREQITAVVATLGVLWIADPLISQVIPQVGRFGPGGLGKSLTGAPVDDGLSAVPAGLALTVIALVLILAALRGQRADVFT